MLWVEFDTDALRVWRTDLECGGKRYSARRRFDADEPGKRCRDPRTARLLSPHSKLRFAPNRCGVELNENQCLRALTPNPYAQLLFIG